MTYASALYSGRSLPPRAAGFRLGPNRARNEYYPTPSKATRALLAHATFDGAIWECACGEGWISLELISAGHDVVSTDLSSEYAYVRKGHATGGIDFLATRVPRCRNIVSNPPYGAGLADQFLDKALGYARHTGGTVAFLLNLNSLAHPSRTALFKQHPPASVLILDDLVIYPDGLPARATRSTTEHRYAWLTWTPATPTKTTTLKWVRCASFEDDAPRYQFNINAKGKRS